MIPQPKPLLARGRLCVIPSSAMQSGFLYVKNSRIYYVVWLRFRAYFETVPSQYLPAFQKQKTVAKFNKKHSYCRDSAMRM